MTPIRDLAQTLGLTSAAVGEYAAMAVIGFGHDAVMEEDGLTDIAAMLIGLKVIGKFSDIVLLRTKT